MIGSVIGAVFNILLDPIFIFSLHMGAGGAALATILSNLLADCYLVWVVFKGRGICRCPAAKCIFHPVMSVTFC